LGMPVTHVELGNELYLSGYRGRFRDGAAYGRVATRWIAAIKREFPGVKVAADAYPGPDSNSSTEDARKRRWNAGLLRTLRGEDALSFHAYFRSGLADGASLASATSTQTMLAAPAARWAALSRVIAYTPPGVEVWVTEWNLFDRFARVHGTWAQSLDVAAFGIDLLSAPRITQADYHGLVSSAPFGALFGDSAGLELGPGHGSVAFAPVVPRPPATKRFDVGAGGIAMKALLGGLVDARQARALSFAPAAGGPSPAPGTATRASLDQPLLQGVAFDGSGRPGATIVNLSSRAATVALPASLRGLPYTVHWAAPGALVSGLQSVHTRTGRALWTLTLEPFSLAALGGAQ
jgi:hypothetical protein